MILKEMIERSVEFDEHKADHIVNLQDVRFDELTAEIRPPVTLFGEIPPLTMTDWAMGQMCQKLGNPPHFYAKVCDPWLQAVNFNAWARKAPQDKKITLRAYDQHCRAVLSGQYSPISNTQVLTKIDEVMGDTPFFESHFLDPDTFHGKFTVVQSKDGNYGIGFYGGNGEIGNRSVRIAPYIQRHACQNSIVFLDWGIEIRHYRVTPAYIFGAIKEAIGQALGKSVEAIDKMVAAEAVNIPNIADIIDGLVERYGLSTPVRDNVLFGTEGKDTLAGVVNGLSFAAQKIENIDDRIDMETLAGAILLEPANMQRKTLAIPREEYEPVG